jgi:hypothetical protein
MHRYLTNRNLRRYRLQKHHSFDGHLHGVFALEIGERDSAGLQLALQQMQTGLIWVEAWFRRGERGLTLDTEVRLMAVLDLLGAVLEEDRFEPASRALVTDLVIRSPGDGLFLIADMADAPGRFVRRGDSLGHVLDYQNIMVQVVVPQSDIDLVLKMTRRVELRMIENIPALLEARVKRVVPAATSELPGEALGSRGGGELALDPNPAAVTGAGANPQATAASSVFIFELELALPDATPLRHIGSRIYARFEREPEPLGQQWYRAVRRVLLSMFNV